MIISTYVFSSANAHGSYDEKIPKIIRHFLGFSDIYTT